jgi:protein gp37
LLGPIDFTHINTIDTGWFNALGSSVLPNLDQIIVGGESGPGARPMHPEWARAIRDQCAAAKEARSGGAATGTKTGPAFFFKQWGEWIHTDQGTGAISYGAHRRFGWNVDRMNAMWSFRVGKTAAGRLLDGRTWDEFPEVRV